MTRVAATDRTVGTENLARNRRTLDREDRREKWVLFRIIIPALAIIGILMAVPILWLMSMSFVSVEGEVGLANYRLFFSEPVYVQMFLMTFQIAFVVTALCVLLGYPVAYLLSIMPPPWSGLLLLAVLVPFWTSGLVRTFSWLIILQRKGIVNSFLVWANIVERPIPLVHNMTGVIIGMTHVMLPFLILPLYASMKSIDGNLMRAAANAGSSPTHAFFRVFLPLSMPGLVAGTIMVFVMSLGFYITPALLGGGRVKMIAQRIEESIALYPTWGPAAALAVLLLAMTGICLAVSLFIVRRMTAGRA
jgi:ABC-type spermidine/putrescine transport system permease subunit I